MAYSSVNKKVLTDLIGILLIALIVVIGYKYSPMLLPKADLAVQPEPACDLHRQACGASLPGGGRVVLSFSLRPIPMVTPFQVEVQVQGVEATRIEVDFTGIDMNMGFNRVALVDRGAGRFSAEASLPVCVTGTMDWQATVLVETGRQRIAIPYRFAGGSH